MPKIYNTQSMTKRRRELRRSAPRAELILWTYLKNKRINGYKFRRQYSIGGYVVDFYCPNLRLAIEVDGPSHFINSGVKEYDHERQRFIESLAIKVLHITNTDIYENIDGVMNMLYSATSKEFINR